MAIFPVNTYRFDPYKSYRFLVFFGQSTTPVAAVSKVSALKRTSDVIEYKEGGNPIILKGLGRTKYEPDHAGARHHPGHRLHRLGRHHAEARPGPADHLAGQPAPRDPHRSC